MKLSDLIAKYGDERVHFQNLDLDADNLQMSNGITKITFGTTQPLNPQGTDMLGLVVWLDRGEVKRLIAEEKAGVA